MSTLASPARFDRRLSLAVVRAASWLIPAEQRRDWKQEWIAELAHGWSEAGDAWPARLALVRRSLGSSVDALWVRQQAAADFDLIGDARVGVRQLGRNPGFTLGATLTLALGIGATTALFSVLHAVVLRPLPFPEADRLVFVWQRDAQAGGEKDGVSMANFADLRERTRSFEGLAALEPHGMDLGGEGHPRSLSVWLASPGALQVLGASPLYGRLFRPDEFEAGRDAVAVLSHGAWLREFGADPQLVGRDILLDGAPHTVVGVLPREFRFPEERDLWVPRVPRENDEQLRGAAYLSAVGRLRTDVSFEAAVADAAVISAGLRQEHPRVNAGMDLELEPLPEAILGESRRGLLMLFGAALAVLLVACANVANLLLARGGEREREFAIRQSLGAGRGRLTRLLLAESVVLAGLGGGLGVLLAGRLLAALVAIAPADVPRIDDVALDAPVLAFAAVLSWLTATLFGLAPALRFGRQDFASRLKQAGTATGDGDRQRLRGGLIVAQIAGSLVLLIGSGLLLRSFAAVLRVDPGFVVEQVAAFQLFAWGERYAEPEQRIAFFEAALEGLSTQPGVLAAGAVSSMPLSPTAHQMDPPVVVEGRPRPATGEEPVANASVVAGDYFQAMGIPLQRGRLFGPQDRPTASRVAVVSQTMARRFWPGEDPLGRRFTLLLREPVTLEIVGVVGDVRHAGLTGGVQPELYRPHAQAATGTMELVVRADDDVAALVPALHGAIWRIDPELSIYSSATLESRMDASLSGRRFNLLLLAGFALLALVLALVGLAGVVSYTTGRRLPEMGIRLALGASNADVVTLVLGQALRLVIAGLGLGLAGAWGLSRLLASQLFGITPTDPATYAAITAALLLAAVLAGYLPARRAAHADALAVIRCE